MNYSKIKKLLSAPASMYVSVIEDCVLVKEDLLSAAGSPDPNDDYLFVLSKFVNAKALVCGDKLLLNWQESPVKLISKKEFEELY